MINDSINKLINNVDLNSTDIKEVFDEILQGLADETIVSSFLTALSAKKPTIEEYTSAILASREAVSKINFTYEKTDIIENIIFEQDKNTLDIAFTNDIICSANNLNALRYTFSSSFNNDIPFKTLSYLNKEFNQEKAEEFNFGYYIISNEDKFYKYTNKLIKKLPFDNILNIISKFLNPYGAKNQFIGTGVKEDVEKIANICLNLDNFNSIVVCGNENYPFVSIDGETLVAEAWKNKIFTYNLNPELIGFKIGQKEEIKIDNFEHNIEIIENIFNGKIQNSCYDAVVINSALALYISKKANSIMDGIELSKKTIKDGKASEKLNQIKNYVK